jgi:electron transfer flavoprotein alpha subunit
MSQDVAVVVEHLEGRIADVSFEMLGKGRELARASGGRLLAALLGQGVEALAGALGAADMVLAVEQPALTHYTPEAYERALTHVLRARAPRVTLVASTAMGLDLAAGLSASLGWPLCAYCRDARLADGQLTAVSQVYGGKLLAEATVAGEAAILSMLPGAYPADSGRLSGRPVVEAVTVPALDPLRIRFRRLIHPETGDVDITRQPILVGVGRGIQSKDNLGMAEELAEALGGVIAASRPVVDLGWLPKARQVGKSGMTVRPKLYVALGISGAPEHLEGMRDAELIVAVNTDPNAPIFDVAHYGIVADLFDVVPPLTEKLKAR